LKKNITEKVQSIKDDKLSEEFQKYKFMIFDLITKKYSVNEFSENCKQVLKKFEFSKPFISYLFKNYLSK
jgi:hypothetical protein